MENWYVLRCQSYGSIPMHTLLFPKASLVKQRSTRSSLKEYYNQTIAALAFDHNIAQDPANDLWLEVGRPSQAQFVFPKI